MSLAPVQGCNVSAWDARWWILMHSCLGKLLRVAASGRPARRPSLKHHAGAGRPAAATPPLPWNLALLRPHAQAPCPRLIAELPHLSGSPAGPTANPQQPRPNSPQFNQFNACGTCRGFQVLSSCPPPPSSTINSQTRLAASLFVTTYHQASLPLFLSSPR